jgi:hypothetical protein
MPGVRVLLLLLALFWAVPASAAVEIDFRSRDFGVTFPHGYIVLRGTLDSTGEQVNANYGFTVRHVVGPSILFGPVEGEVESLPEDYVAGGNHHFTMVLSDEQYRAVMALVERWRALPQPSYRLDRRNCVSFIAEIATLLGLEADPQGLMRRPKAFLDRVRERNEALIAAHAPQSAASATASR